MTTYQLTISDLEALTEAQSALENDLGIHGATHIRITYVYPEKQVTAVYDTESEVTMFEVSYGD